MVGWSDHLALCFILRRGWYWPSLVRFTTAFGMFELRSCHFWVTNTKHVLRGMTGNHMISFWNGSSYSIYEIGGFS